MAETSKPSGRAVSAAKAPVQRGDVTARAKQSLEADRDEAARQAAADIAAQEDAERQARQVNVIDYTKPYVTEVAPSAGPEEQELDENDEITFVCRYGAEQMAYGIEVDPDGNVRHGRVRLLDFEEGHRYKVPYHLYKHLDRIGLVYH